MSTGVLTEKLTFDDRRLRSMHLRIAVSCREVAKHYPEDGKSLRAKMRQHALQARRKWAQGPDIP